MAVYTLLVYGEMCPAPLIKAEQQVRVMGKLPCRFRVAEVADGIWEFQIERV